MKLTFLLTLFPLIAPALSDRTKGQWVEDLHKVTQDYENLVTYSQRKDIPSERIYFAVTYFLDNSRKDLLSASSFQQTAANPNPAHGYHVTGGSCVAIAEYFPKVATPGIKAMEAILDPLFACSEDTKKYVRRKLSPWRGYLDHINSLWHEYDSAYYDNCKDEPGAKQHLQQNYLPLKKRVQEARDAYQDIDAYCATRG